MIQRIYFKFATEPGPVAGQSPFVAALQKAPQIAAEKALNFNMCKRFVATKTTEFPPHLRPPA
jgi:hypothetical protein